jgi:cell division FtsZ-interacting protein ZapD
VLHGRINSTRFAFSASSGEVIVWLIVVKIKAVTLFQAMLKTVAGIYENGQIQLSELPQEVSDRAQVLVTFLEPGNVDPSKLRQLIDQLETIAGIQQAFEQLDAGQTRPIEDFIQTMQQKYGITG